MRLFFTWWLLCVTASARSGRSRGARDDHGESALLQERRRLSAASDLAALNACFRAWGSPNSSLKGGWGGEGPVCSGQERNQSTWTGVDCAGDVVVALDVTGMSLSGSIPSFLGGLTGLTRLDLGVNSLSGSIPSSIGALTGLASLSFDRNSLSGSIPSSIGGLTGLTFLNLAVNSLSSSIPSFLSNLTQLSFINLGSNKLSGSIPSFLSTMRTMTYLDFNTNQLSGSIPSSLDTLTSLTVLSFHGNSLSGSIPSSLGALTGLNLLALRTNSLSGSIPSTLGALTSITYLDLDSNKLSGSIPSSLGSLTKMSFLYFGKNSLSGSIPSSLVALTALMYLDLQSNMLSGSIPTFLGRLTGLRILDLEFNNFLGSLPSELGLLTGLTELYLNFNSFTGLVPSSLGDLRALTKLYLFYNDFTGPLPNTFCNLFNNIHLHIETTQITSYPACLKTFKYFEHESNITQYYTASPSPFPSSPPTMYPTSTTTLLPAQWKFAAFQVSQTFVCVGPVASCSSAALFKPILQAANSRLWARYADRETQWLTEKTIVASAALSFNDVSSVAGGFLINYFYTFRPIDLRMSSMEAVRLSFQRAVASSNLTAYNAELLQVLRTSTSNPLSALTAPLECTKIDVGAATLANGVPTAFPTTTPVAVFVLSAQIALGAAAAAAVAVSGFVWFMRAGLQQQHSVATGKGERIVVFWPLEFALPIIITITAAASNVYQIDTFFQDPSTAALATVMTASRVAVALYSCTLLYLTLNRESYNKHLAATLLHKATLWVAVAALALLDPTHLRFFPWRHSEFAERSRGFPTLHFFKLALGCTAANALLQLSVSAARGLSFSSVASLVLSLLLFCNTIFTIVVKLTAEKIHEHDLTLLAEQGDIESMAKENLALRAQNAALRAEITSLGGTKNDFPGIALVPLPQPKRPTVNFDDVYNPAAAAWSEGNTGRLSGQIMEKYRDSIPAKVTESKIT